MPITLLRLETNKTNTNKLNRQLVRNSFYTYLNGCKSN
jgi:hypothetical protein